MINGILTYPVEMWKTISECQYLSISTYGRVYNCKSGKFLKPCENGDGYKTVFGIIDGKRKKLYIHRLVSQAFISNPDNLPVTDHAFIPDRSFNFVWNLRHCSYSDNTLNKQSNGKKQYTFVEQLPENSQPFTQYNGHTFKNYYVCGTQLYLKIVDTKYRQVDVQNAGHYCIVDVYGIQRYVKL